MINDSDRHAKMNKANPSSLIHKESFRIGFTKVGENPWFLY